MPITLSNINGTGGGFKVVNNTNSGGFAMAVEPTYTIGQAALGGIVFYINGGGSTGTSGLIAATSDQSTGIQWYNGNYSDVAGAKGEAIGTGLTNTDAIIAIQGETTTNYAAGLARAYTGGGFNDWYLPSRNELTTLYNYRTYVGGFSNQYYWTSTQVLYFSAYARNMVTGDTTNNQSNVGNRVRAIRSF